MKAGSASGIGKRPFLHPQVAVAGGLFIVGAALWQEQVRRALLPLALGATAGLGAAYLALHAVADTYPESGLLRALVAFLAVAALVCAFVDRWTETSRRTSAA
ncbi:hypothetical protein [Kitasatospora griseola]